MFLDLARRGLLIAYNMSKKSTFALFFLLEMQTVIKQAICVSVLQIWK